MEVENRDIPDPAGRITSATWLKAQLQETGAWLQTILSSIGEGVIVTDTAGKVALLNPVGETLTGWAEHGALGSAFEDVFRLQKVHTGETLRLSV